MPVTGVEVLHVWRLGITGLAATISTDLNRYADEATQNDASEAVAVVEYGSTGVYALTYTPTLAQTYVLLATESTFGLSAQFESVVSDAPATATADDAYCSEADVVAYAQTGDYTASTTPTENQVLQFAANRAGQLYLAMREEVGDDAPSPTSGGNPIDTSTDKGTALANALRLANAKAAAADALQAAGAGDVPAGSERAAALLAEFYEFLIVRIPEQVQAWRGHGYRAATHVSAGEVTPATVTARTSSGLRFSTESQW